MPLFTDVGEFNCLVGVNILIENNSLLKKVYKYTMQFRKKFLHIHVAKMFL